MKACSRCKISKPLSEFHFKNKQKGIRHSYCRDCHAVYLKAHYQSNPSYYKKKARARNDVLKQAYRDWLVSYLATHPCVDCGETELILLEFDHVAGDKRDSIANMIRMGYKLETLMSEIEKCVIRCMVCHRRKTAREGGWWNAPAPADGPPP